MLQTYPCVTAGCDQCGQDCFGDWDYLPHWPTETAALTELANQGWQVTGATVGVPGLRGGAGLPRPWASVQLMAGLRVWAKHPCPLDRPGPLVRGAVAVLRALRARRGAVGLHRGWG